MTHIRRATIEDAAALAELGERTFRDAFAKDNRPEDLEAYLTRTYGEAQQRRELADPSGLAFVVDDDGRLIAFAQLRRDGAEELEIARFYVERGHHGAGLAHELMETIKAAARDEGIKRIWLGVWEHNPRAIRFYEKCGFVDYGSHPFLVGSDLQTDRLMAYVIPAV